MHPKDKAALEKLQEACDLIAAADQLMDEADEDRRTTGHYRYRLLALNEYSRRMMLLVSLTASTMRGRQLHFQIESQKYVGMGSEHTAPMIGADIHWKYVLEWLGQSGTALFGVQGVLRAFAEKHIGEEEFE